MEYEVPIANQYLMIEGIISPRLEAILKSTLGMVAMADERVCFLTFAYDDIPLGFQYEVIYSRNNPSRAQKAKSIVKLVTQQFSKPFDGIPRGWKTITLLSFPEGLPSLIKDLPVVDDWYESERDVYLCLSSEETWRAVHAEYQKSQHQKETE